MTEFNAMEDVAEQDSDEAALEEANYWFTINEFIELILRYGPQQVLPDFERQMEKAKKLLREHSSNIIVPDEVKL